MATTVPSSIFIPLPTCGQPFRRQSFVSRLCVCPLQKLPVVPLYVPGGSSEFSRELLLAILLNVPLAPVGIRYRCTQPLAIGHAMRIRYGTSIICNRCLPENRQRGARIALATQATPIPPSMSNGKCRPRNTRAQPTIAPSPSVSQPSRRTRQSTKQRPIVAKMVS